MSLAALAAALALGAPPDPAPPAAASDDDELLVVDTPVAAPSAWSLTGRALVLGAADASREGSEDALETFAALGLALRWEPSAEVALGLEGRLAHHLGLRPGAARGGLEPELFEARLTWRPSPSTDLEVGVVPDLRWPALVDPQPLDLHLGPLPATGDPRDRRRPLPVVRPSLLLGAVRLEALWQPLFVPSRVAMRGTDWAPLAAPTAPDALADLPHPKGLAGSVVGLRGGVSSGTLEAGLAWLWRWDPSPTAAGFRRQHVLGASLAAATGSLHWRLELAWEDARTAWLSPTADLRRPALTGLVAVSAAPAIFLDGELSLRGVHLLGAPVARGADADLHALGEGPDDVDLHLRVGLLLAYDGVLRLDLEARRALARADGDLQLGFATRLGARVEATLGLTLFGGAAVDAGRGALYDADDQLWVRVAVDL